MVEVKAALEEGAVEVNLEAVVAVEDIIEAIAEEVIVATEEIIVAIAEVVEVTVGVTTNSFGKIIGLSEIFKDIMVIIYLTLLVNTQDIYRASIVLI